MYGIAVERLYQLFLYIGDFLSLCHRVTANEAGVTVWSKANAAKPLAGERPGSRQNSHSAEKVALDGVAMQGIFASWSTGYR